MTQKAATDALADILRKAETWCAEAKTPLIFGALEDSSSQIVRFEPQTETPHEEYLVLLDRLNVSAVVIEVKRLTQELWQNELTKTQSLPDALDRDAHLRRIDQLRPHVGHIAYLMLRAFLAQPHLILCHQIMATWHEEFEALEYEDEPAFSEDEIDPRTTTKNNELARQLATHPRFPFAKNFEKRRYLAESVFKTEKLSDDDILAIVERAQIFYDVDIKT